MSVLQTQKEMVDKTRNRVESYFTMALKAEGQDVEVLEVKQGAVFWKDNKTGQHFRYRNTGVNHPRFTFFGKQILLSSRPVGIKILHWTFRLFGYNVALYINKRNK